MINSFTKKIKIKFTRYRLFVNPKLYRPTSKPFISGDTFRKMADHIFDETKTLKVKKVKKNDIIFVRSDLLKYYFENYHLEIKNPYILISHNSDETIDDSYLKYVDDKIIHWFCSKLNFQFTKKITPLPFGLENKRFGINGVVKNFLKVKKLTSNKNGILCSFNENTNYLERHELKILSLRNKDISVINYDSPLSYLLGLNKFKFNLCPDGNGGESHRIWESIIFGVTPIVLKNQMNLNFFLKDVPLLMLESWEELNTLTYYQLSELNKVNASKSYIDYISYNFWFKQINSKKY